MTSFLQPLPYLVRPQGPENCQLTSSFVVVVVVVVVVAQTVVRLLQTTQILSDVCFITDHVAYASSNGSFFFFFTRGGCASCLRACLGARLLPQSYHYPNLSEGADRVGGQLRGDTECPFSGVTKFGRVWRKVPESDARSVGALFTSAQLSTVWLVTRFPMQNLCWD